MKLTEAASVHLVCPLAASSCRYDGPPPWHAAPHGSSYGNAPWPRSSNGNASSRHEAATSWHERQVYTKSLSLFLGIRQGPVIESRFCITLSQLPWQRTP